MRSGHSLDPHSCRKTRLLGQYGSKERDEQSNRLLATLRANAIEGGRHVSLSEGDMPKARRTNAQDLIRICCNRIEIQKSETGHEMLNGCYGHLEEIFLQTNFCANFPLTLAA